MRTKCKEVYKKFKHVLYSESTKMTITNLRIQFIKEKEERVEHNIHTIYILPRLISFDKDCALINHG